MNLTRDIPNSSAPHLQGSATATAQWLTAACGALDARTEYVDLFVEGPVRLTLNATVPTGTLGVLVTGGGLRLGKAEYGAARVIRASTATANVALQVVQYAKEVVS